MRKFLTILKREYTQVVKKKSFVIMIFLTPLLMVAFMLVPAFLAGKQATVARSLAVIDRGGMDVGERFVSEIAEYTLPDESAAAYRIDSLYRLGVDDTRAFDSLLNELSKKINDKKLSYVLVINEDAHLSDTNLYLVTNSDNFRDIRRFESVLSNILSSQRLEQSNINLPIDSVLTLTGRLDLELKDTSGEAIPFLVKYFGALIFVMLMYVMIISYGATLMRSVIEEKSSRIMEVLISSVSPFQLMLGKVVGLGLAAFTQVAVWVLVGVGLFLFSGSFSLSIDPAVSRIAFNPAIVIFFVLFFVTGYIMYSTLFALIGSIVNSDKEAQHFIFPITISLITPVMAGMAVIQDPYATWVMVMTYIPLVTPTMMTMRVIFLAPSATSLSLFSGIVAEATIGLIVVVIASLLVIWVTSRIFRIGILMYGKRPTLPELVKWMKY